MAETLDIIVSDELGSRDYTGYSGGEAARVALAIRLSLAKVISRRAGKRVSLIMVDEVADLDVSGSAAFGHAINSLSREHQCLVVSHDETEGVVPPRAPDMEGERRVLHQGREYAEERGGSSMKIGQKEAVWVLLNLQERRAGCRAGLPPGELRSGQRLQEPLAAELMQTKAVDRDLLVEVLNPHQVIMSFERGQRALFCTPLDLGDRVIFARAGEIMYPQFLDEKSPIVVEIRKGMSGIVAPGDGGESHTAGGIILPGAGTKV